LQPVFNCEYSNGSDIKSRELMSDYYLEHNLKLLDFTGIKIINGSLDLASNCIILTVVIVWWSILWFLRSVFLVWL